MRAARNQGGFSLLEVLMTVVLLGIGITALLGGLGTAATSARGAQSHADYRALLYSTAEAIAAAVYSPCAGVGLPDTAYTAARAIAVPTTGSDAAERPAVTAIDYWDGTRFVTPCTSSSYDRAAAVGSQMQRLTLHVSGEYLTIIKRRAS